MASPEQPDEAAAQAAAAQAAAAQAAAAQAAELGGTVADATQRLLQTAATLTDAQAREPSLLPGWSRGHVLTHLARSADGMRNLLVWARTGVETPQYPSREAREHGIEAGAGRPVAELTADVAQSAAALTAEAATLTPAQWTAQVRPFRGDPHPAWYTLWRRMTEVEVHHVDLDAGYGPDDWPPQFAATCLDRVSEDFARPDAPPALLHAAGTGAQYRIGPDSKPPEVTVTGPTHLLLAWLIGRGSGDGLRAEPGGTLPPVPAW